MSDEGTATVEACRCRKSIRWSQGRAVRRLVLARRSREVLDGVVTRTIRVDRAVPKVRRAVTAARVDPQVRGPDEFSAPTG